MGDGTHLLNNLNFCAAGRCTQAPLNADIDTEYHARSLGTFLTEPSCQPSRVAQFWFRKRLLMLAWRVAACFVSSWLCSLTLTAATPSAPASFPSTGSKGERRKTVRQRGKGESAGKRGLHHFQSCISFLCLYLFFYYVFSGVLKKMPFLLLNSQNHGSLDKSEGRRIFVCLFVWRQHSHVI